MRRASVSHISWDDHDAIVRAIHGYNADVYRGRTNVDIDTEANARFRAGIPNDRNGLVEMVRFIGEDYGGAQRRFLPHGYRTEAELIVANVFPVLADWRIAVESARPLLEGAPEESIVTALFAPFRGTKRWPVWATKTLHFLRPNVFPILDSRAKKAVGLRSLGSSPRDYRRFCERVRTLLMDNAEALDIARTADRTSSPSDLKLLDKILYQLGCKT
jgi:hypothetical protein